MSSNQQRRDEAMKKLEHEIKSRDLQEKTKPLGVVITSVVVILAVIGAILFFATRNSGDEATEASSESTTTTAASSEETTDTPQNPVLDGKRATPLAETVSCEYPTEGARKAAKDVGTPPTADVPTTGDVTLTLVTNDGDIPLQLDRAAAPCAVNALRYLAEKGYYNDTVCHRITTSGIKVLQCGDPTGSGAGGPGFSFADEYPVDEMAGKPVVYPRGSIAMANAGPATNGSQFFLNYGDSPLAASYTYLGTITEPGLTVLDGIAAKGAVGGAKDGKPAEDVKISEVKVSK